MLSSPVARESYIMDALGALNMNISDSYNAKRLKTKRNNDCVSEALKNQKENRFYMLKL